jgi:hypothetical protein
MVWKFPRSEDFSCRDRSVGVIRDSVKLIDRRVNQFHPTTPPILEFVLDTHIAGKVFR